MWSDITERFSSSFRVVTIDLPGHGKSDSMGYIHTMDLMAEIVMHLLNHLSISSVYILGHSMGGYVSCSFLRMYPGFCKGIFLMNSTSSSDSEKRKMMRDQSLKLVMLDYKSFITKAIPLLFDLDSKDLFNKEIEYVVTEALKTSKQGVLAAIHGMKSRSCHNEVVKKTRVKKTMFVGTKDPVLNVEKLKQEAKKNQISLHISDSGHMSHVEALEELINAIEVFMTKE